MVWHEAVRSGSVLAIRVASVLATYLRIDRAMARAQWHGAPACCVLAPRVADRPGVITMSAMIVAEQASTQRLIHQTADGPRRRQ